MPSVLSSGSQTATLTTEHTLHTATSAATLVLAVDAANLVNGEQLTLRIYGKARSSDTERLVWVGNFQHAQTAPLAISPPIVAASTHAKFTLEQNGGTGRAFPWAVYDLA